MTQIWIEDQSFEVADDITVAAALQQTGPGIARWSVRGQPRGPFCGMGVCQECRVSIDGVRRLACQSLVEDGMRIQPVHNEAEAS